MKALIVDDDPDIVEAVSLCFEVRWPEAIIVTAENGAKGLAKFRQESPDLVVLDLGLPDMDGLDVCKTIRGESETPIIILTVRDQRGDIVRGLELGADDYITKPFDQMELLARVRAVLRRGGRSGNAADDTTVKLADGKLTVDFDSREVRLDGELVRLTPTEYSLLETLVKNRGKLLTHQQLLSRLWGQEYVDATDYLKVHVLHLRRKLKDDAAEPKLIATERGIGYKFVG
jgi:two-component system KDP operon response regulator KdpE